MYKLCIDLGIKKKKKNYRRLNINKKFVKQINIEIFLKYNINMKTRTKNNPHYIPSDTEIQCGTNGKRVARIDSFARGFSFG